MPIVRSPRPPFREVGAKQPENRHFVVVIGAGPKFLSGISYYTHDLATALARYAPVGVILMRRLMPLRWYPGRAHVRQELVEFDWSRVDEVHDGVDWFWLRSLRPAVQLLRRRRPSVVVIQWWTGTVLHSLLLLAFLSRLFGARVVVEFHEVQDVGELSVPLAGRYVKAALPWLLRQASGFVVHSEFDRAALDARYDLGRKPVCLIPHPVYTRYRDDSQACPGAEPDRDGPWTLLYFGVIRPFKGVEDLVRAFEMLDDDEVTDCRLVVVGETWEGWTLPAELIAASPRRDQITFLNRYVPDEEVGDLFASADVVVLPYHRSSASGPLQIAMGMGKPVIVSAVGGLIAAVADYPPAQLVPPRSPADIADAIRKARAAGDTGGWALADAEALTFEVSAQRLLDFVEEIER